MGSDLGWEDGQRAAALQQIKAEEAGLHADLQRQVEGSTGKPDLVVGNHANVRTRYNLWDPIQHNLFYNSMIV